MIAVFAVDVGWLAASRIRMSSGIRRSHPCPSAGKLGAIGFARRGRDCCCRPICPEHRHSRHGGFRGSARARTTSDPPIALRLVTEKLCTLLLGIGRDEARAAAGRSRHSRDKTPLGRFSAASEQIAHGRDRAVVQVGRTQPDAVERQVGVAVGFAEMREPLFGIGGVEIALLGGECVRCSCRGGTGRCGSWRSARPCRPVLPEKSRPFGAVAVGAVLAVKRLAARRQFGIDRERIFGRLVRVRAQPVGDEASAIPGRAGVAPRRCRRRRCGCAPRRCCCCRPSAAASPPLARGPCSQSDGKIDDADRFRAAAPFDRPVQQRLCRPERIETARPGRHLVVQEAEAETRQDQRLAHRRNRDVLQQQPLAKRIIRARCARRPARPARD